MLEEKLPPVSQLAALGSGKLGTANVMTVL